MNLDDLTDEELEATLGGGPKAMKRSRAGSQGTKGQKLTFDNMSDDELEKALGGGGEVSRGTSHGVAGGDLGPVPKDAPSYSLPEYGGREDKRAPFTQDTQDRKAAYAKYKARRGDDPFAQDPIAQGIVAGTLGAGAGAAVGGAGALASGAANGLVSGATAGGGPEDILIATLLGAGAAGLQKALPGTSPARVPRTQAEMDASALKMAPPERPGLPQGEHGTVHLASEADAKLRARLAARDAGNGARLDAADAEFAALDDVHPPVDTRGTIDELGAIRRQTHGGDGPLLGSDPHLEKFQRQLTTPNPNYRPPRPLPPPRGAADLSDDELLMSLREDAIPRPIDEAAGATTRIPNQRMSEMVPQRPMGGVDTAAEGAARAGLPDDTALLRQTQRINTATVDPRLQQVPRAALRNIQKALNERANFAAKQGATLEEGALQQGAGAVARTARGADPTGRLGQALDAYGTEADALRELDGLMGPPSSSTPKLARYGSADKRSDAAAIQSEGQVRQLTQAEPVANDLISMIRARNVRDRRSLKLPSYIGGNPLSNTARGLRDNGSNLMFKLNPPRIDELGRVAARGAQRGGEMALPLEIQLMLMEQERQHAGQ